MAKNGPARQSRVAEKVQGRGAISARLRQVALMEVREGLVEVDQRRPHIIFFRYKHRACLGEEHQGMKIFVLLAKSHGGLAERLGRFVSHAKLLKASVRFPGQIRRILIEIQLQVNLRKIKLAERCVVNIAGFLRYLPRAPQQLNRAAVLSFQKK